MNKRLKKKIKQTQNRKLLEKYPFMIVCDWCGNPMVNEYRTTGYDDIPDGWRISFGKLLLRDLKEACIKDDCLNSMYFVQIKEKYGQLRMYANHYYENVEKVISAYSSISEHICIICGDLGSMTNISGWYEPYCSKCIRKIINKYNELGMNVDIQMDSEPKMITYYEYTRYSDGKSENVKVDISKYSNDVINLYNKRMKNRAKKLEKQNKNRE